VFTCEPEWASLSQEIGGDRVKTVIATHAGQDAHYVRARPSLIAAMRRSDLVFCSGADLEVGWLPILLRKAGKRSVQPGQPGHLLAARHVKLLEAPEKLDRSLGDVHPQGNPHVHLNPNNISILATVLADRLRDLDPPGGAQYERNAEIFLAGWRGAVLRWEQRAKALRGMPVMVHHKAWTYLVDWLALDQIATLEPKPGLPPTSSHLTSLLQLARTRPIKAILRTPYDPDDAAEWLANKTSIPSLQLPFTVGGDDQSGTLFLLFDRTLTLLEEANGDR
jgi:zinc/manganese transport system substrate-binding protein